MLKRRWSVKNEKLMYLYIALFVMAVIFVGTLLYNSIVYDGRIYNGIKIAGVDVGGKTKKESKELLEKKVSEVGTPQILLNGEGIHKIDYKELAVTYDIEKTVDIAYGVGRDEELKLRRVYDQDIPLIADVNHDVLAKKLFAITRAENTAVVNATAALKNGNLETTKEALGKRVLLGENIEMLLSGLGSFENEFDLKIITLRPDVMESDIKTAQEDIKRLSGKEVLLKEGSFEYKLTGSDITSFLKFINSENKRSTAYAFDLRYLFPGFTGDEVDIIFDRQAIRDWGVSFSKKIDTEPSNAKLGVTGGNIQVVVSSKDGKKVKLEDLADNLKEALNNDESEVQVPVEIIKAEVRSDNLNELGLKGLVSTGWSDFSGSPANRIHNVKTGASKFNGVLIKPGEKFSFNNTLGPVEAYTGYLPELVIKKDKTVPEYGGGLCQVSSTAFRAALNAGMPIISRSAHAYPVVYYKPYGVDATIYLPTPDLVFQNDTSGYILIQTRINGNKLYFDFYGTKKDVTIKFAGDAGGTTGVSSVAEGLGPTITEQEARGKGSFTATFYRLIYDASGKLIKTNYWVSRYDSPDKYPH